MSKAEPKPQPEKILLTKEQAAEVLQVSVGTLENWRYQRKGPPFMKIGGLVRYEKGALHAWIDAQTVHEIPAASGQ